MSLARSDQGFGWRFAPRYAARERRARRMSLARSDQGFGGRFAPRYDQ